MKINNFRFKGPNEPNRIEVDQITPNKTKVSRMDSIRPNGLKLTEWTELDRMRPKWIE